MRRLLGFAIALAMFVFALSVRADDEVQALRLHYETVDGCPSRTSFEGALHFRSSRIVSVGENAEAPYDANVVVTSAGDRFHGTLRIGPHGGEETTRDVEGPSCETVVEALGFAVAVLLDPEGVNSERLPSSEELSRIAESARAKVVPPKKETPTPPPLPPPKIDDSARLHVLAEIGGGAWSGVEALAPRAHAAVELRSERRTIAQYGRLGGFFQPSDTATSVAGGVTYLPTGGRIDSGLLVNLTRSIRAGGGLHVTMLVMSVDAPLAQERFGSLRVVPSLGPVLRASWEPAAFGVAVDLAGGAHLLRERYRVEGPPAGGEVFRLPLLWVQGTIGVVVRFRDL